MITGCTGGNDGNTPLTPKESIKSRYTKKIVEGTPDLDCGIYNNVPAYAFCSGITTIFNVNTNYLHVEPNSHFWATLESFLVYLQQIEDCGNQFYHNILGAEIEYLIIGLQNTKKHGYKIRKTGESKLDFLKYHEYPIFVDIDNIIVHLKEMEHKPASYNSFKGTVENTINSGLNLTNGLKMERKEIYKRLDGERDYKDEAWGTRRTLDGTPDEEKPVAEWINYIEYHLSKAKDKVYHLNTLEATDELRKVAALAVRAMEIHGCPERQSKVDYGSKIWNPLTEKLPGDSKK
jgi:hypothetical protein